MEIKDMKYTIQNEVDRRVKEELREVQGNRSITTMLTIIAGMLIGFIVAKIQF